MADELVPFLISSREAINQAVTGELGIIRRRGRLVWDEIKKLGRIVGPAIFCRIALYSMTVLTQAFVGHLGDLELASLSIALTLSSFNFGLMMGMASALETLCGQAYGARQHHLLGVYLQRSCILLFACVVLLLPMYVFAAPLLELVGLPAELSRQAGRVCIWIIPQHVSYAFAFPLTRFMQSQLKNWVTAVSAAIALAVHIPLSWLVVCRWEGGVLGASLALGFSWWLTVVVQVCYVVCGGCPGTWRGLSMEAFVGLWEFTKLSAASGVMLCVENWYYSLLILLAGNLTDSTVVVDAISICTNINSWELMIPFGFFAGIGVRVANELGAGNAKKAKFATIVSIVISLAIGIFFSCIITVFHKTLALIFTTSPSVLDAFDKLYIILACAILLNSVQPVLSGVAVGAGWQIIVSYVNIVTYYIFGLPLGILLGRVCHLGVQGIWAGMIGGTALQTFVLAYLTVRCDWEKEAQKAAERMEKWAIA